MKEKRKSIVSWILVLIWMVLIFYLSAQVAAESDHLSLGITQIIISTIESVMSGIDVGSILSNHLVRKSAHFFAYLTLGILVINALTQSGFPGKGRGAIAWGISVLYAVSDEVHQLFVPGRSGQIKDVLIDSAGAMVGIGLYLLLLSLQKGASKAK